MGIESGHESLRDKYTNNIHLFARNLRTTRRHPIILLCIILVSTFTVVSLFVFIQNEPEPKYVLESSTKVPKAARINLTESVRVLCYMQTTPNTAPKKAIHGKNTWGRRCNKLLLMSSKVDEKVGTIGLNAGEGRNNLANKTFEAFQYIYEHHLNEYDWFMKVDDDSYVVMENLRYFLYPYSPEFPIFFGCKFHTPRQVYFSGGSGYVLSREALRRLVEVAFKSPKNCSSKAGHEDTEIGRCLQYANVTAGDTRDSKQRERFLPMSPQFFMSNDPQKAKHWYTSYSFYEPHYGPNCCSDLVISFHYVPPIQLYVLDYLIYEVHPYGIEHHDPELLPKKTWEEAKIVAPGPYNAKTTKAPALPNDVLDVAKMIISIEDTKMDNLFDRLLNNTEFRNKISKMLNK